MVTVTDQARGMLDALVEANYSLPAAATTLNLSISDSLDAAECTTGSLDRLERFQEQIARIQLLDARMQALRTLVEVCKASDNLEKKRLAAQAILRFNGLRATDHADGSRPPPRTRGNQRATNDTATARSVPPEPATAWSCSPPPGRGARAAALRGETRPQVRSPAVAGVFSATTPSEPHHHCCSSDDGMHRAHDSTPHTCAEFDDAAHTDDREGGTTAEAGLEPQRPDSSSTSTPATGTPHGPDGSQSAWPSHQGSAGADRITASPSHRITLPPSHAAALAAAAGHAISVFAFLPLPARPPPAAQPAPPAARRAA